MSTYETVWQCVKCKAIVPTIQRGAGFFRGYGDSQLANGPCPEGGDHEWHQLRQGTWRPDEDED